MNPYRFATHFTHKYMKEYFYIDSKNQQVGPIAEDKLLAAGIQRHTLVWCQGMDNWTQADAVPELRRRFEEEEEAQKKAKENEEQTQTNSNSYGPPFQGQSQYEQPRYQSSYYNNRPPLPDSYLVWAVLTTICCCLPFGIVAILKANQVSGLYYRGLYDEAYLASADAKKWTLIAFFTGLITCFFSSAFNLFHFIDFLENSSYYFYNFL